MSTRNLRVIRVLTLFVLLTAGVFAWRGAQVVYRQELQLEMQREALERAAQMEAGVAFSLVMDHPAGGDGAVPATGLYHLQLERQVIEDWEDPPPRQYGSRYALFLPGVARKTGLRVQFGGQLALDGQPLESGQLLELAEGEHLLSSESGRWPVTVLYGSELPCIFLETASGSLDAIHEDKANSEDIFFTLFQADGTPVYGGPGGQMRGHGNASWFSVELKSYQLTFPEKTSFLEMPEARRWLLVTNQFDKSLLRNQIVYGMAEAVGMPYTPETRLTELYINGEYRGCYLLSEKVEVDENRVDLPDLDELNETAVLRTGASWDDEQLALHEEGEAGQPGYRRFTQLPAEAFGDAGGYLIEFDITSRFVEGEGAGFVTRVGRGIGIKSPSSATWEQVEYIASAFQRLEDILYPPEDILYPPEDGTPAGELEEIIDLHSFAQKYLIEEIAKNLDANSTSQYFYKLPAAEDTRLFAGPAWDYDHSLACEGEPWEDLRPLAVTDDFWADAEWPDYNLWAGLCRQPEFARMVRRCFFEEFEPVIGPMLAEGQISQRARQLAGTACMNAMRLDGEACDLQAAEQDYLDDARRIEDFLAARMEFLESEWTE